MRCLEYFSSQRGGPLRNLCELLRMRIDRWEQVGCWLFLFVCRTLPGHKWVTHVGFFIYLFIFCPLFPPKRRSSSGCSCQSAWCLLIIHHVHIQKASRYGNENLLVSLPSPSHSKYGDAGWTARLLGNLGLWARVMLSGVLKNIREMFIWLKAKWENRLILQWVQFFTVKMFNPLVALL